MGHHANEWDALAEEERRRDRWEQEQYDYELSRRPVPGLARTVFTPEDDFDPFADEPEGA